MGTSGRVALVTGGANGLGRAIAERLAREGISVVIGDLQHAAADAAAQEISAQGAKSVAVQLDVASEDSVSKAYEQTERRFGKLDILVNNAGVGGNRVPVEQMSLSEWESTLRINLTGAFLMSRAALPLMKRQKWGRIVNISSLVARTRGGVGKSHYAASKSGMIGLSRVLADEVGRDGITVNCVAPSRTRTPLTLAIAANTKDYFENGAAQTALGRIAEPTDTANVVAFLCSDEASFLTGAVIDVNGGAFMP